MSDDLPEPETPVTQINVPSGRRSGSPLRLCPVAPVRTISWPLPVRRSLGTAILRAPVKYSAVRLGLPFVLSWSFSGSPAAITWPPCAPARSEEHTSELQSRGHLVCRLLLEKKNIHRTTDLTRRDPATESSCYPRRVRSCYLHDQRQRGSTGHSDS